jgi:hypothetical protein
VSGRSFRAGQGLAQGPVAGTVPCDSLVDPGRLALAAARVLLSDDGMFHLYRLAALDKAMHAGVIFPRWFPDFAFGYGFPVLNFYSPLGYYLAEVLHLLGGGMVLATKLALGASLALSALAMYLFAKQSLDPPGALLASLAYTWLMSIAAVRWPNRLRLCGSRSFCGKVRDFWRLGATGTPWFWLLRLPA